MRLFKYVIILLAVSMIHVSAICQVSHISQFSQSDAKFSTLTGEDGVLYQRVSYAQAHVTVELGKPELPERYIRLLVPENQDVESISVNTMTQNPVVGEYLIYPVQRPIPLSFNNAKPQFEKPDQDVYSSNNSYPEKCVKIAHEGYFDGSNHIITIAVYPYQYQPKSGKLVFNSTINFTLKMKSGKSKSIHVRLRNEKQQKIYDQVLKHSVDNVDMISAYQTKPSLNKIGTVNRVDVLPYYDYVIITSNALRPYFNTFVSWKTRVGLHVGIVTTEDIYANYSGDLISGIYDDAGKIRQYLSDAYTNGTTWALLAGDNTVVPVRYGASEDGTDWSEGSEYKIPSDLYYSDFNGDWNVMDWDEIIRYGEYMADNVDYNPEIFVGRVPCENAQDVVNWVEKVILYETNPGNGDASYVAKSFWIRGDDFTDDPNNTITHLPSTLIHTLWDQTIIHSATQVVDEMSNHYGMLNWYCHGDPTIFRVKPSSPDQLVWTSDSYSIPYQNANQGSGLNNLTNSNFPSIVYSTCCNIAAFDNYKQSFSAGKSLVEGFMTGNSRIGGPALLGYTRDGFQGVGEVLHSDFADLLALGANDVESGESYFHLGVAEAVSRQNFNSHMTILTHNLFGCPETELWTASPATFTNASVTDNGNSLTVNTGESDCTIAVSSGNNGASYSNTVNGVSSNTFPTSVRPLYVVITKHNYIPYAAVTGGTFSSDEDWFGRIKVLGGITVSSGSTLTINPNSTISFVNGVSLVIHGALKANGIASSPITLTSSTIGGTWGGIVLSGSGANNSVISNATIRNVQTTGGSALTVNGATGVSVDHCTIYDNVNYGTNGILLINAGSPMVSCNTISNNGGYGISYYNTNGDVWKNTIQNNSSGGIRLYNSSPNFGHNGVYAYNGNNYITGGAYGIFVDSYSYPFVGSQLSSYVGYNSILNNTTARIYASYSEVLAENNWWGEANPPYTWFQTVNNATIEYVPCLLAPPLPPMRMAKTSLTSSLQVNTAAESISTDKILWSVREANFLHQPDEAAKLLSPLIKDCKDTVTFERAIVEYLSLIQSYPDNLEIQMLLPLCQDNSIKSAFTMINLARLDILSGAQSRAAGKFHEAKGNNEKRPEYKLAGLSEFYHYFSLGDVKKAEQIIVELKNKCDLDEEILQALWLLDVKKNPGRNRDDYGVNPTMTSSSVSEIQLENYPNPFNPSTTIVYAIPQSSVVSLKVYDILGREVATLVNEYKTQGRYSVSFDVGRLSSGMYIYRIQTGTFTATKKMNVLK